MEKIVELYPDGACENNKSKVGGWALVIIEKGKNVYRSEIGWSPRTTNQRMELIAMFHALYQAAIWETKKWKVEIYCDSAYVVNCFLQGWYKDWQQNNYKDGTIANIDLWNNLIVQWSVLKNTEIIKIKGHSGIKWNELADELARGALAKGKTEREIDARRYSCL